MNSHTAAKLAKNYVENIFSAEPIGEVGLEEINFDEAENVWLVTIGFRRDWRDAESLTRALSSSPRTYKVVKIDNESEGVRSLTHREFSVEV